jgi:hypothetical protein
MSRHDNSWDGVRERSLWRAVRFVTRPLVTHLNKFRARLHLQSSAATPIQHAKPPAHIVAMYHIAPGSQPLRVTIDDTTLSRCVSGLALFPQLQQSLG